MLNQYSGNVCNYICIHSMYMYMCVIIFVTGHVTIGGSICMEMLTKSGWRPTNDIEVNVHVKIVFIFSRTQFFVITVFSADVPVLYLN